MSWAKFGFLPLTQKVDKEAETQRLYEEAALQAADRRQLRLEAATEAALQQRFDRKPIGRPRDVWILGQLPFLHGGVRKPKPVGMAKRVAEGIKIKRAYHNWWSDPIVLKPHSNCILLPKPHTKAALLASRKGW